MDRQGRAGLLFVLPALVYFCLVFLVPLIQSIVWSFYRSVPGGTSSFAGRPPRKWLQSLDLVLPSLALVNVWVRLGFDTIIFLAALQAIPSEYYEAAGIDGASRSQSLRHVTLPLLNPQIVMVSILELI